MRPPSIATVSLPWHPGLHADAAHRWLCGCVREACAGDHQPRRRRKG